jgi:hypothetical protein
MQELVASLLLWISSHSALDADLQRIPEVRQVSNHLLIQMAYADQRSQYRRKLTIQSDV